MFMALIWCSEPHPHSVALQVHHTALKSSEMIVKSGEEHTLLSYSGAEFLVKCALRFHARYPLCHKHVRSLRDEQQLWDVLFAESAKPEGLEQFIICHPE